MTFQLMPFIRIQEPWQTPLVLRLAADPTCPAEFLHDALLDAGCPSKLSEWLTYCESVVPFTLTNRVECLNYGLTPNLHMPEIVMRVNPIGLATKWFKESIYEKRWTRCVLFPTTDPFDLAPSAITSDWLGPYLIRLAALAIELETPPAP